MKLGLISTSIKDNVIDSEICNKVITLLPYVLEQNYCQYINSFCKPKKGVVMGPQMSGYLLEIFLQNLEQK